MTNRLDARATHLYSSVSGLRRGTTSVATLLTCFSVLRFALSAPLYPRPALGGVALLALVAMTVMLWVVPPPRESPTTRWQMIAHLAACVLVLALDLAATWHPGHLAVFPATCAGVGGLLFAAVTTLPPRDVLLSATAFGAVLLLTLGAQTVNTASMAGCLTFVAIVSVPPFVGVALVRSFRSIIQVHSEIAQTRSTIATDSPVGMLASDELTRLDSAAEQLLDDVAAGRETLPLAPATAERASVLASQLRLRLVDDRKQTWLHHAVTESAVLDPVTTIDDPEGLAASLSTQQRDGLFSAIWLLVGSAIKPPTLSISLAPGPGSGPHLRVLRIVLDANGVSRRQIDAGTWQAIRRMGQSTESGGTTQVRIEVDCLVDIASGR